MAGSKKTTLQDEFKGHVELLTIILQVYGMGLQPYWSCNNGALGGNHLQHFCS